MILRARTRHRWTLLVTAAALLAAAVGMPSVAFGLIAPIASGNIIKVGPDRALKRIADAARVARDGDTIEVDAGDYTGDVAIWDKNDLTIRAVGGQAKLVARGASAEGKAIWVVRGNRISIDNFVFTGARVGDHNGAGVRLEKGQLRVAHCVFSDNENGLISGNDADAELEIEASEFGNNGAGDGQSHNLYVGGIRRLSVTASYFHHGRSGHLLKSRARETYLLYNRITDEAAGHASYELELPAGGINYVIGNIIEQGPETENSVIISVGAESYAWPKNEIYLIHNTIVDDRPSGGVFLRVKPGAVRIVAANNVLSGKNKLDTSLPGEYAANFDVDGRQFAARAQYDFRLRANSPLRGRAVELGAPNGFSLRPTREYEHPLRTRPVPGGTLSPGAFQTFAP